MFPPPVSPPVLPAAFTVTTAFSFIPYRFVTVIVAVPVALAVITPSASTSATAGSLVVNFNAGYAVLSGTVFAFKEAVLSRSIESSFVSEIPVAAVVPGLFFSLFAK